MATKNLIKALHDEMLSMKPSGVEHPADCPMCSVEDGTVLDATQGGDMSNPTYTQEEVDAAIALAVKDLQSKLDLAETTESFAKEKEALEAKIAELQVTLDKAVLDAEQAKSDQEALVAYLTEAEKAEEEAEAAKVKKAARVAKMKEYAFNDEYLDANADRWTAMSDEGFDAYINDLESSGAKKADEKAEEKTEKIEIPASTAMTAAAETKTSKKTDLREVLSMRMRGIDPNGL